MEEENNQESSWNGSAVVLALIAIGVIAFLAWKSKPPVQSVAPAPAAAKKEWHSKLMATSADFTSLGRLEGNHRYFLIPKGHWDCNESSANDPRFTADGTSKEAALGPDGHEKLPNLLDNRFELCALLIKVGRNGAVMPLTSKGRMIEPGQDETLYAVMNDGPSQDDKAKDANGYQDNPGYMDITITEQ